MVITYQSIVARGSPPTPTNTNDGGTPRASFLMARTNGQTLDNIVCYHCGNREHLAKNYAKTTEQGFNALMSEDVIDDGCGYLFTQHNDLK